MLLRAYRKGEVLLAVTATNALSCLRLRRSILLSRAARQTACRRSPALRLEVDPLALDKLEELRTVAALDVRLRLVNTIGMPVDEALYSILEEKTVGLQ